MSDSFQELYEKYEVLSAAKQQISEKSAEYVDCIRGTKGNAQEKKLAAQILAKFFKHFPHLQQEALDAILDLCEDPDSDIRICAMKFLPVICKETKETVTNIASILTQLLQLEGPDYNVASNSLQQVYKIDPLNAIEGIFQTLRAMDEESLREKMVEFLFKKLIKTFEHTNQEEIEEILVKEAKKLAQDCTAEEFMTLMTFMLGSKWTKLHSQPDLFDLIGQKIEIHDAFKLEDVDRLILCIDLILPQFTSNDSAQFVKYYCQKVLPKIHEVTTLENGRQYQIKLLRQLALMSPHCNQITSEALNALYECLKLFMPAPPDNDADSSNRPDMEFCHIECLLFAFHKLARHLPEFLLDNPDELKDFQKRLQYLACGVQGCKRALGQKKGNNANLSEEDLVKVNLVPKVFGSLDLLIKDLYHQPPCYKVSPQLSFTVAKSTVKIQEKLKSTSTQNRHSHKPITFDSANGNAEQSRGEGRKLYQPPSGKFSSGFGSRGRGGSGWSRGGQRSSTMRGGRSSSWRN